MSLVILVLDGTGSHCITRTADLNIGEDTSSIDYETAVLKLTFSVRSSVDGFGIDNFTVSLPSFEM